MALRLQCLQEPLAGGRWVAAVGAIRPGGTWVLLGLQASGAATVWRGSTDATYSQFVTDGTSLFVIQADSDLTAGLDWPPDRFRMEARAAKPWHAWRTLQRIDENGPVQVARYDWDVEGTPPQPEPALPQPPTGGFRVHLSRALPAATVPPALSPLALWCRRLVPSPTATDLSYTSRYRQPTVSGTERYRPPLERFGRQVGWAYPFSAWQIPWVALFALGVSLHARKRGSSRRVILCWCAATAAFGLAGALAYALTRSAAPHPGPVAAATVLPVLRDPAEAG